MNTASSTTIRAPAIAAAAWEERGHWAHRAEVRAVLGAPPPPLWVRARCAFLEARLDTLFTFLPGDEAGLAEWQQCEAEFECERAARERWPQIVGEDPDPARASEAPAGPGQSGEATPTADSPSPDPAGEHAPVQSGHPPRAREEAREAVRALLAEGLTDREIARRIGVSPSTVGAVRKAAADALQDGPGR